MPDTTGMPNAPTDIILSPLMTPNPQSTSARLKWTASTVPAGASAVTAYRVYLNNSFFREVVGSTLSPVLSGLSPDTTYSATVTAVNASGEGSSSVPFSFKTAVATTALAAPTGLASSGKTQTQVSLTWNAVTGAAGYRIYVGTETTARATSTVTSTTVTGLVAATAYSFTVTAYDSVGESARSTAVTVTTDAPTAAVSVMRADDILNNSGINTKVSYASGTYDYSVTANKNAVIDYSKDAGFRIFRFEIANLSASRTAQLDYARALYNNQGSKFHGTIGIMRKTSATAPDVPNMTEAELRVHAATIVMQDLDVLVQYWKPDTQLANGGDLAKVIHSIGGPNEIEETTETGANWARNARIWQEQLWRGMREGKFWSATANAGAGGFTAQRIGAGTTADFRAEFANIPIAGPSTRTDLTLATAETAAGSIINTTTGDRQISQWVEMGNIHQYQNGRGVTSASIDSMIDNYAPFVKAPGYPTVPYIFSETGYNHMGWGVDGADLVPNSTFMGNVKVPPWVISTYIPRAIATFASYKIPYVLFELLDDPHTAGWDIQAFFGQVFTPTANPTDAITPWVTLPSIYALRRMYNLLRDRTTVTTPATHSTTAPYFSITGRGGAGTNLRDLVAQKADGSYWLLLWRDVDVFNPTKSSGQTVGTAGNSGNAIAVPDVNITLTFTQATGTKTVDMWQPNKAVWDGTTGSTKSVGHGTSATWATIPAGESTWTVPFVAGGSTITVPVGPDLKILRIQ